MIEIKVIDKNNKQDINIPNQPFKLYGKMIPSYTDRRWSYTTETFDEVSEMCFPDENYDYDELSKYSVFLGAYDGDKCVGLAILQEPFFSYMYLYDFKVNTEYRGKGVAQQLMDAAKKTAYESGYKGLYTQGQDNNLAACLFYIKSGFRIGGFDSELYKGTNQEGKADIIFYWDGRI